MKHHKYSIMTFWYIISKLNEFGKEVWENLRVSWVKPEEHPCRILDIKICWYVTEGSRDADPKLLCSSGMKGCPPQVFRVQCAELFCQILQLYNTNCNIWLRQNNSSDLVLTYMDNTSKYKILNNSKRTYCCYPC